MGAFGFFFFLIQLGLPHSCQSIFKIRTEWLITYLAIRVGNCGGLFKSSNKCCDPVLLKWMHLLPIVHEKLKEKVEVLFG